MAEDRLGSDGAHCDADQLLADHAILRSGLHEPGGADDRKQPLLGDARPLRGLRQSQGLAGAARDDVARPGKSPRCSTRSSAVAPRLDEILEQLELARRMRLGGSYTPRVSKPGAVNRAMDGTTRRQPESFQHPVRAPLGLSWRIPATEVNL